MSDTSNPLILYLWDEEHGEDVYEEIKEYGFDNATPCNIQCIEITDVHANEWLSNNAAQVDASHLPCFLLTDVENGTTSVVPVGKKEEVYRFVVEHYF